MAFSLVWYITVPTHIAVVDEVVLVCDALGLLLPPIDVNSPGIGVHTLAGYRMYHHAQEQQAGSELQQKPTDLHECHCRRSEHSTCVSERTCHSGLHRPNGNVSRPRVDKTEGLEPSLIQMDKYNYFYQNIPHDYHNHKQLWREIFCYKNEAEKACVWPWII